MRGSIVSVALSLSRGARRLLLGVGLLLMAPGLSSPLYGATAHQEDKAKIIVIKYIVNF